MPSPSTPWWVRAQAALTAAVAAAGLTAAVVLPTPEPVGEDVLQLVGQASQAAVAAGAYRSELTLELDGPGPTVTVDGTVDLVPATGDARGEIGLPGGGAVRFLATDGRGYLELPPQSPSRLAGKRWVGYPLPPEQGVGEDPLRYLALLSGGDGVVRVGREDVRGTATTHYRAPLDPDAVAGLAATAGGSGATLPPQVLDQVEDGRIDVWLDEGGLARRLRVALEALGVEFVLSFEIVEYGADVVVDAPPASEVLEVPSQAEAQAFLTAP